MQDIVRSCPYCGVLVGFKKFEKHVKERCPKIRDGKSPNKKPVMDLRVPPNFMSDDALRISKIAAVRRVQVKSRLARLYSDLSQKGVLPDDKNLAVAFLQFYQRQLLLNDMPQFDKSELSVSIKTVSGGLPSLGKRSK